MARLKFPGIPHGVSRKLAAMREVRPKMVPLPASVDKPRILYFIVAYPTFSETYMHEEIASLSRDFEIRIITYRKSSRPRSRAWQYDLIEYQAPCLVYGKIEDIDLNFEQPEQQDFIRQVDAIIEEFKPDVLHAHYLGMSALLKHLSERHHIPFTLRTHSMDILSEPQNKLEAYCEVANSPWCKRVIAFPASAERLVDRGLNLEQLTNSWPILNFAKFHRPDPRPLTGRVMCCGPAIKKKAHKDFIDLALMMRESHPKLKFDLYAEGPTIKETRAYNEQTGAGVKISYVDPDKMSDVYPRYDWLLYPSDPQINKVGLPVGVAEAQASGIGVCWQELPGRRQEQLDFLAGGGFLYKSLDELPAILSRPYPENMRQLGFKAAKRCDIEGHRHLLSDVWNAIAA